MTRRNPYTPCACCGDDRLAAHTIDTGYYKIPVCATCEANHRKGGRRPCFLCFGDRLLLDHNKGFRKLHGHRIPICHACRDSELLKWLQANAWDNITPPHAPRLRVKPNSPLADRFREIEEAFSDANQTL